MGEGYKNSGSNSQMEGISKPNLSTGIAGNSDKTFRDVMKSVPEEKAADSKREKPSKLPSTQTN